MDVDRYLGALALAGDRLVADAVRAGVDAAVPSCPQWHVAGLLGHVGVVHRWATAVVADGLSDPADLDAADRRATASVPAQPADLADWVPAGVRALAETIRSAPADVPAVTFLHDAPAPRRFWARRAAHETTIHAVDALAARLDRLPTAPRTGIGPELAADGLDELLTGFLPRRSSRLRVAEPRTVLVTPADVERSWLLELGPEPPRTTRDPRPGTPDARWTGSAAALYLGLWNRGDEIGEVGTFDALGLWRDRVRISWS